MSKNEPAGRGDRPDPDERLEELVAYLDGELDARQAEQVEARIGLDPRTRVEADALKRTWDLLDVLPQPEPSRTFTERTLERLEPVAGAQSGAGKTAGGPWRRRLRVGAAWAAALLAAGAVGWFVQGALHRRTPEERPAQIDVADLRILENLRLYRHVDDIEFLRALDTPDMFGDDQAGL